MIREDRELPESALGRTVQLLPAGELFRQGYPVTSVAVCGAPMTAERSRRFALTGQDPEGRNRTIILRQETDLVDGKVVRRVVLTLNATMNTATVLTPAEAIEVAQAMLAAAR